MKVSKKYTHIFQLKSVGGDDGQSIVTLTGAKDGQGNDWLELRHSGVDEAKHIVLAKIPWSKAKGRWIKASATAIFKDAGYLNVTLRRYSNNANLLAYNSSTDDARKWPDMWRNGTYVRAKWGIFRSLEDKANLNQGIVFFADFCIR